MSDGASVPCDRCGGPVPVYGFRLSVTDRTPARICQRCRTGTPAWSRRQSDIATARKADRLLLVSLSARPGKKGRDR